MWCECKQCGSPVALTNAKESEIITLSKVDPEKINDECAILLSHCGNCADFSKVGPADATIVKVKAGVEALFLKGNLQRQPSILSHES